MPLLAPRPVHGTELLERLRGGSGARPVVDPGLAGGLREWLEDALAPAVALVPGTATVRVTKEALNQVLVCEAHLAACRARARPLSVELARGTLVDALFRQWVTVGAIGDPWADALAAVEVEGDDDLLAYVAALDAGRRRDLVEEVGRHAAGVGERWPVPGAGWMARTQERLEIPVCGGRVVLAGVIDLVLGGPAGPRASVCLVELKSGGRRLEHRGDLAFYALLETLRAGAPPFRIATYYSATGDLDVEPVGEDTLHGALRRVLDGAAALCRLAAGREPARTPNPLCAWCAGLPHCPPGQERAGTAVVRAGRLDGGEAQT
ncbi:MAG TPA: PD-(D/E)XK nuclease family protein [Acidimicrobiales bacterium]|nr:PD-(D/E)XK nuclease family protein [Acidimicrobiales bacterium]